MESDLVPYQTVAQLPARHALVIAPHADDEVFGCGGAMASHVQHGIPVSVIVLTDGSLYGDVAVRMAESRAAAGVLGYGEPEFWAYPDRALRHDQELVGRLVQKIAATGADLVYAPSPWEVHPDHRQAAGAAAEAVRRTGVRIAFYEVGSPLRPNLLLDITAHAQAKQRAMQCFASQMAQQDYGRHIAALNLYRTYTLPAEVTAAEAYLLLSAADLGTTLPGLLIAQPVTLGASPSASATLDNLPLVSVLIRSMDRQHLQEALDSVALQTYPRIEVVVVAAQPGHQDLPPRCGPFELRLIPTEQPLQRSQAANQALAQARGEFLLFLDDDDWLLPGHVARLAQVLQHLPASLAAYTGVTLLGPRGEPQGQVMDLPYDAIRLLAGNLMPIHAVLFSHKLLALGCQFDETLSLHEDWDFWLQVARHTAFAHVPGVSAAYRMSDSSGVHTDSSENLDSIQNIFNKWQTRWEPRQAIQLMQRVRSHDDVELRLADKNRSLEQAEASLVQQRQTVHQQAVNMDQLLTRAEQQRAESEQRRAHAEALRQRLEQELARTEQRRAETEQQRVHAEALRKLVEQELARTEQQRAQAELQATRHAREVADLLGSASWRVTAPLRWLSARLRRKA
ncbi:PIG-L family deacetylase [Polaromonas sp.]|uniref:PIG-L family deacetylase n=1 Tax=Polaromonas sp. TaxID=1869339 RepID=UPI003561B99E